MHEFNTKVLLLTIFDMNMMGVSIKSGRGIKKPLFWCNGWLMPTPPSSLLFHNNFYCIIGEYHHMIREARISALIPHLVPLSMSRHATSLVVVILCLLSKNSLAWDSIALHSPNYFCNYYHYIFMVKANKEYHIPIISENKAMEWGSLLSCRILYRDLCERFTDEWRACVPKPPPPPYYCKIFFLLLYNM